MPHQDSTFLYTDPPSCIGLWLALEDATRSNGCLWGLKGVHKQGPARRFMRLPEGGVGFDRPAPQYDLSQFEPIECAAGTLVLLHGANVHYRWDYAMLGSTFEGTSFSSGDVHLLAMSPCAFLAVTTGSKLQSSLLYCRQG